MKVGVVVIMLWVMGSSFSGHEDSKVVEWYYIERFAPLAVEEMLRVGIPASVKLAQAVVESNAAAAPWRHKAIIILGSNAKRIGKAGVIIIATMTSMIKAN